MRGQALLELALCAPVVLLLTLGGVATTEIVDARAGLEAATRAAACEAARAPDPVSALRVARTRFASIVAGYPLRSANLRIAVGGYGRSDQVLADATAQVELSWSALVLPGLLPAELTVQSHAAVPLEPWRTHT